MGISRRQTMFAVIVTALALTAIAVGHRLLHPGFSPWLESRRLPDGSLPQVAISASERAALVALARKAVEGAMLVPAEIDAFIEETDTEYIVTFPTFDLRGPGADYYAQIRIDKSSRQVTKVWVGS